MDGALNPSQVRVKELALVLRPAAPEAGLGIKTPVPEGVPR